MPGINTDSN